MFSDPLHYVCFVHLESQFFHECTGCNQGWWGLQILNCCALTGESICFSLLSLLKLGAGMWLHMSYSRHRLRSCLRGSCELNLVIICLFIVKLIIISLFIGQVPRAAVMMVKD